MAILTVTGAELESICVGLTLIRETTGADKSPRTKKKEKEDLEAEKTIEHQMAKANALGLPVPF